LTTPSASTSIFLLTLLEQNPTTFLEPNKNKSNQPFIREDPLANLVNNEHTSSKVTEFRHTERIMMQKSIPEKCLDHSHHTLVTAQLSSITEHLCDKIKCYNTQKTPMPHQLNYASLPSLLRPEEATTKPSDINCNSKSSMNRALKQIICYQCSCTFAESKSAKEHFNSTHPVSDNNKTKILQQIHIVRDELCQICSGQLDYNLTQFICQSKLCGKCNLKHMKRYEMNQIYDEFYEFKCPICGETKNSQYMRLYCLPTYIINLSKMNV